MITDLDRTHNTSVPDVRQTLRYFESKHWSIGRPKEMKKDLQVYFRTYTVEGPDVLRIARNHLELTVFVRTQKIRVPDVRHHQRLVDFSAAFYPLIALIEEFFGPL